MNPFYDLNKKLNSIGNEQEQIAKEVAKAVEKTPARKTLEESLRSDLTSLMEGTKTQKDFDKLYAKAMSTPEGRKKVAAAEKSKDPHSINKAVGFKESISNELAEGKENNSIAKLAPYAEKIAMIADQGARTIEKDPTILDNEHDVKQTVIALRKVANLFRQDVGQGLAAVVTKLWAEPREMLVGAVKQQLKIDLAKLHNQAFPDAMVQFEDGTGGMNFSGSGSLEEKAGYSAKKAAAGKDIGKPGKNFAKIEKSAAKKYGSKEAGARVAGAVLNKLRHANESQLNEYFIEPGGDVTEMLNLNLFDALLGETALVNHYPEFKQSQEWMAVVKEWKPVALQLANEIRANKGTQLSDEQCDALDDTVYDGSDAYDDPRDAASYFPGTFQEQADLISEILGNLSESGLQAYLGKKKYGQEGMKALQQAGRDHAGKEKMAKIRSKYDKMDEADMEEGNEFSGELMKAKAAHAKTFKVDGNEYPVKEQGAGGIHGSMPDPMTKKDQQKKMNPPRSLEEKDYSDEDIMDYLNRKLAPHDKQQQAKEDAQSKPFNGPADAADAYNGMFGTGMEDMDMEESSMEESVSRKHFQQVADLLKNIPDEAKRKEMALHHASIFKQQNPRFDIRRFAQAAGVDLEECAMWEELKGGQVKLDKNHDGKLDANDFAMLRKGAEETDEGWADAMAVGKAAANQKPQFSRHDVKDTGYSKVYTRKPETFDEPEGEEETSADTPKRGRGRPATGKAAGRKTKGAYKHKRDVEEESTDKEDTKAERAGKKVAKDIEHDEGHKGKDDNKAEKAGKKVTKDIEYDDKKDRKEKKTEGAKPDYIDLDKDGNKKESMKKAAKDKEEKVDETTTSGSVATTAAPKASKGGTQVGKGIYDSWNREFEQLLAESVNVTQEAAKMEDGNEEESITINVSGDDVARFKEVLASMGLGQQAAPQIDVAYDDSCGTCGGTPCQCDEQLANANGATLTGELDEGSNEVDYSEDEDGNGNWTFNGHTFKLQGDYQQGEGFIDNKFCCTYETSDGGTRKFYSASGEPMFVSSVDDDSKIAEFLKSKFGDTVQEADVTVSQNEPDYPSNEEESDDALQYSGGLNGPKSTGQTTIPVVASQEDRLHTMEESEDVDSFLNLYQSFKTK